MKVLVTGSHGMVGSALVSFLTTGGDHLKRLVRVKSDENDILWSPELRQVDPARLEGFDAVVHLAGENIGEKRWSADQKRKIRESRVISTRFLSEVLSALKSPPEVFISASAVGFYGDRGEEELAEGSAGGEGFLAEVCREWEAATAPAARKGIRVVNTRFGMILSGTGGALTKMLPPFKLGLGGRLSHGRQYLSWIALDDVLAGIYHVLRTDALSGAVNFVSPSPVTNREFTQTLSATLKRPAILPVPAFAIRTLFGEMGEALLLQGQKVHPQKLLESGYVFHFPLLKDALGHVLSK